MTRGDIPGFGRTFGHSKLTLPNLAAVPAALGGVSNAGKYLTAAGWRPLGQRFALARAGRHGAACRVVVGRRIERRIGVLFATLVKRCGPFDELTAPIVVGNRWELGELALTATCRRRDWRMTAALAISDSIASRPLIGNKEVAVLAADHWRTPVRGKNRNRNPSPKIRHTAPSYVRMRIARVCG